MPEYRGNDRDDDDNEPRLSERQWEWATWTPRDATVYHPGGRRETIPDGWDHDHCIGCHAMISAIYAGLRAAYHDAVNDDWLCPACYAEFVAPYVVGPGEDDPPPDAAFLVR